MEAGQVPSPGNANLGPKPDRHTFYGRQSHGLRSTFSGLSCVRTMGLSGTAASHKSAINESCVSCHIASHVLRNRVIVIATDNTTVLLYLKRQGGSGSLSLLYWTQRVFQVFQEIMLEFRTRHIPGRQNLLADQLSPPDQVLHMEWSLNQGVLDYLWSIWVIPEIDIFATQYICNSIQQPSSKVLFSSPRFVVRGSGCIRSGVKSPIPLSLSTIQHDSDSASKVAPIPKLQRNASVSSEARSSLVPTNSRPYFKTCCFNL